MIITPYRYPGAKNKMLPILMEHIDKMLVGKNSFCDAFVGGGSVLLEVATKYPNIKLFCCDKDFGVSSFWNIISDTETDKMEQLIEMLAVKPTVELFDSLRMEREAGKLKSAYKSLFFNRTCFSGITKSGPIGGKDQLSKYKVDCRYNYKKIKEKILACHKLLVGRTTVHSWDISDYIYLIDKDISMYCDPPYVKAGEQLYIQYMTIEEHKQLAECLNKRKSWVLSYDNDLLIPQIYKDCDIYTADSNYCISGEKTQWNRGKSELIIIPR